MSAESSNLNNTFMLSTNYSVRVFEMDEEFLTVAFFYLSL